MVNKESIQRSGILTDKSLSFLSFKREFLEKSKYFQSNKIRNYFNVSDNDWNSWKWQLRNQIKTAEKLKEIFDITQHEFEQLVKVSEKFRLRFHLFLKCTLCQGHYDFFLFRFLLYICLLCRGIKVMPLIDCFHLLL